MTAASVPRVDEGVGPLAGGEHPYGVGWLPMLLKAVVAAEKQTTDLGQAWPGSGGAMDPHSPCACPELLSRHSRVVLSQNH